MPMSPPPQGNANIAPPPNTVLAPCSAESKVFDWNRSPNRRAPAHNTLEPNPRTPKPADPNSRATACARPMLRPRHRVPRPATPRSRPDESPAKVQTPGPLALRILPATHPPQRKTTPAACDSSATVSRVSRANSAVKTSMGASEKPLTSLSPYTIHLYRICQRLTKACVASWKSRTGTCSHLARRQRRLNVARRPSAHKDSRLNVQKSKRSATPPHRNRESPLHAGGFQCSWISACKPSVARPE